MPVIALLTFSNNLQYNPYSIMKPPIVETVPVPPPFVGKFGSIHNMMGHSPMMGYHGGGN